MNSAIALIIDSMEINFLIVLSLPACTINLSEPVASIECYILLQKGATTV